METPTLSPLSGRFMGGMPQELRAAVELAGTLVRYSDGATVQQRGDHNPGLSIVVEGSVLMSATDSEGDRSTYIAHGPGDSFGEMTLFLDIPRTLDAVAVGETAVREVSRTRFTRLLDGQPALRDHLLSSLARQLSLALERLDDHRRLPTRVQLAKTLLDLAEPDEEGHIVRASQTGLAETIGTSRVTTGKALSDLGEAGLVVTGYRAVHIPDRARLEAWIAARSYLDPIIARD